MARAVNPLGESSGNLWAYVTTLLAVGALARTVLPGQWLRAIRGLLWRFLERLDPYDSLTVQEFVGSAPDVLYEHVQTYLSAKGNKDAHRLLVSLPKGASQPVYTMADNASCEDRFKGATWWWTHAVETRSGTIISVDSTVREDMRSFLLKVKRAHSHLIPQYMAYIKEEASRLKLENRELQVYSNLSRPWGNKGGRLWDGQPFVHPSSFDTLVLDHALKNRVVGRLDEFKRDADFYRRTGRAHKLGLFLHGPPGTGKTSLISAIANYMQYSIYDLDLTGVSSNMELRNLLSQISNRAVIVLEDIDTVGLESRGRSKGDKAGGAEDGKAREPAAPPAQKAARPEGFAGRFGPRGPDEATSAPRLTLGGVLNFADGLRSACGDQRIFIFTTNFPEVLDPALLRPGRMDLHVSLSYCSAEVFQDLCHLYLGSQKHKLLPEAMRLISEEGVQITPADVTGILDADRQDPTAALQHAVKHLSGLLHKQQQQQQQQQSQSLKLSEGTAANGDRHA